MGNFIFRKNNPNQNNPKPDYFFKVIFLGEADTGRTSLLLRYTKDLFSIEKKEKNIRGDHFRKYLSVDKNKLVMINFWDSDPKSMVYYKGVNGVIFMYDITNRSTFDRLNYWFQAVGIEISGIRISKVLIGNKCDLEEKRMVSIEEGKELANKHNMLFFETSAKTKINLEKIFYSLSEEMITNYENRYIPPKPKRSS